MGPEGQAEERERPKAWTRHTLAEAAVAAGGEALEDGTVTVSGRSVNVAEGRIVRLDIQPEWLRGDMSAADAAVFLGLAPARPSVLDRPMRVRQP